METRKINRVRSRSSNDAELVHFTLSSCFAEDGKEMYKGTYHARAQLSFIWARLPAAIRERSPRSSPDSRKGQKSSLSFISLNFLFSGVLIAL